jgi:hypothetical protein
MERRTDERHQIDERHQANLDVTVTDIAKPERSASGRIADISEAGISAELPLRFDINVPVKVQMGDCTLFGHVTHCTGVGPGAQSYRTGIEVARVLVGQSDLSRLIKAVLAESMPATPGVKVVPTR